MRIVIDGRLWVETGPGRYIRNLVTQLQKLDQENEYFLLLQKKDFNKVELRANVCKVEADFKWYGIREQLRLPALLKKLQPDLVHFPHFNVPILYKGKFVVTIHDLIHQHFQMSKATTHGPLIYKFKKLGYRKVFSHALSKASKIITPSQFVKDQLYFEWRVDKEKIIVTHEGVDEAMVNIVKEYKPADFSKISQKFKVNKPYLYYVGNAHPHKNIPQLMKAFAILEKKYPHLSLVLSGPDNYFWQKIKKESHLPAGKVGTRGVIFTGPVTDRELVALYKNSLAFITASLEEGFGIPILEAMACGTVVVCSNKGSLPEVGGKAAIYFDPLNIGEMVSKMSQVISDGKLQKELIKKGKERVQKFSWREMAKQTLEVYQSTI